jgi:hypothetical protein
MDAAMAIPFPIGLLACAAAGALPRGGAGAGVGAPGAVECFRGITARAPRGAARVRRSFEPAARGARARRDGVNSKKETKS